MSKHACFEDLPSSGYGAAVNSCTEDHTPGVFWVGNDEYASAVRFCPFCGERAPVDPKDYVKPTKPVRK